MILRRAELDAIRVGKVDLAFRCWDRARLRLGTRMRTAIGVVEVTSVGTVAAEEITEQEARRAGARSRDELIERLARQRAERPIFRIGPCFAGPDPRVALREDAHLDGKERATILASLARLDRASPHGPWTRATLALIEASPATRAPDLAAGVGRDTPSFKRDVRKLKELGLTESLEVGYRLSPRGEALQRSGRTPRRRRPSWSSDGGSMPRFVPALLDAWLLAGRLQRKLGRGPSRLPPYREIFRPYVQGASFADVGTMWSVDGRYAFEAEEEGAASVTAFDGMKPTPEFEREHERRSSRVCFVQGDINDPVAVEAIGRHDAVWCSGVVYHSPDPHLTVRNLCQLADRHLFVGSSTLPELPGLRNACVFLPGLSPADRRSYARVHHLALGLGWPFDPQQWYANWWWGITPSALRSMVEADGTFEVVETVEVPFMAVVVARRVAPRPTM